MAGRSKTERRLIELNDVEPTAAALGPYLEDRSNHVVAKALDVVRDERVAGLEGELEAAFRRFLVDPVQSDPGCVAKLAAIEALDLLETDAMELFRIAARCVQMEPAFDRPVDTAPGVRIRGARGLVRLRAFDVLTVLAEHLADLPVVQSAAAQGLAENGDPAGGALVRLRILAGVPDGEVLTDCLCALLGLDPVGDAVEFVAARLRAASGVERRAAALALGEMRVEGAVELLRDFFARSVGDDREVARTALGLLRSDAARDFLDSQ